MPLHIHRAERTDLLADGLGALLADPLPDPFAEELVLVPARGVERWLSQRLSHVLGAGRGGDGVCAGVSFRSPGSLIAEITGTVDDDPWSPDAMTWPLLEVIDASLDQPWCAILARHLGHFHTGDEAELRRGRRYSVARRLAGLFASYARQRPQLLIDWLDGDAQGLDTDLAWQPELWRALVERIDADPPHIRHQKTLVRLREGPSELPARLSLFGHTRLACTDIELLQALSTHHELHLWLPHPSDELWRKLATITAPSPAATTPAIATSTIRCLRRSDEISVNFNAACPLIRRPTSTCPVITVPIPCSGGCSPTSPPMPFGHKDARSHLVTALCRCTAAMARPVRSTCCARCCSGCCKTTRRWSRATSW